MTDPSIPESAVEDEDFFGDPNPVAIPTHFLVSEEECRRRMLEGLIAKAYKTTRTRTAHEAELAGLLAEHGQLGMVRQDDGLFRWECICGEKLPEDPELVEGAHYAHQAEVITAAGWAKTNQEGNQA